MKSCPECFSEYEDTVERCPDDGAELRTVEKDPLVGSRLADRYDIESVIGRGGMGVVYKARQGHTDRTMAIKMLHSHMVAEPEAVKRFYREAKTVSQVRHHNIITLFDFGMNQGQPYIVMEFLEGTSLKSELKDRGALSFERGAVIFKQVVDALASAHGNNVVHRDLKPENIMLSHRNNMDDWVTLVDFGLSKLKEPASQDTYQITKSGDVCGSPPYMSPEQCLSATVVDPRSDIYALGVVVYESLTLKLPFNARSAIEMLDCHLYAAPIPFNQAVPETKVCSEITNVLNKSLEKDPNNRYATVQEFGEALKDALHRDGLKVRTMKHREEVAQFHGLVQEAAAISKATREIDKKTTETELDGVQFVADQSNGDDGEYLLGNCPYCGTEIQGKIKFCVNCQRQLVSPQELSKLRTAGGRYALPKTTSHSGEHGKGFSSRAKSQMSSRYSLADIQRVLTLLFLVVLAYGAYFAVTNENVLRSLNRMVAALQH